MLVGFVRALVGTEIFPDIQCPLGEELVAGGDAVQVFRLECALVPVSSLLP